MYGTEKGMTMRLDDEDIIVKPRASIRPSRFELLGIVPLGVKILLVNKIALKKFN